MAANQTLEAIGFAMLHRGLLFMLPTGSVVEVQHDLHQTLAVDLHALTFAIVE
jgi:hypothetical protein